MSKIDQLRQTAEQTDSAFEVAEEYVRDRWGMSPALATVLDVVFLLGFSLFAYYIAHAGNVFGWIAAAVAVYFALVSLVSLINRFRGGSA